MKVLHVTYRFGEDIVGGAENYLWNLSRHLTARGVEVTVATTTARDFHTPTRWNVFWDEGYPAGEEIRSGIRILRFPFSHTPKWLAALYGIPLQRRFDSEEWRFPPPEIRKEGDVYLGRGWYFEEPTGEGSQRWIGSRAEIHIRDQYVYEAGFSAFCPWKNSGEVFFNGEKAGEFSTSAAHQYFSFKTKQPLNNLDVGIRLKRSKRPWRDLRTLGMIVSSISYKAGDKTVSIPLHRHYASLLYREKEALLDWLEKRATARSNFYGRLFDLARGPYSKALVNFVRSCAQNYDLILGHDFPHYTLRAAVEAGKNTGVPTAALPLAHLEDDYYHWRHYYKALADADLTFSLSDYARDIFRNRFHANAHTLGGGIDLDEFEKADLSGARFRKKYGLNDTPFVLFAGRKSYPKRYDALIRAVRIANQTLPCRLVMIGPDENRQPVDPADALYLGKINRADMLDAYDACDAFAMLSESESFGMVFTEAWMRSRPVIGYKHCGAVASLISDGADGFLCDSDEEAARRIIDLLGNPDLAQRLGEAGRHKTLAYYTWNRIADKALGLYRDTIEKKKASP